MAMNKIERIDREIAKTREKITEYPSMERRFSTIITPMQGIMTPSSKPTAKARRIKAYSNIGAHLLCVKTGDFLVGQTVDRIGQPGHFL